MHTHLQLGSFVTGLHIFSIYLETSSTPTQSAEFDGFFFFTRDILDGKKKIFYKVNKKNVRGSSH